MPQDCGLTEPLGGCSHPSALTPAGPDAATGTEHTEVVKTSGPVIACDGGGSGVRRSLVKDGLTSASEELLSQVRIRAEVCPPMYREGSCSRLLVSTWKERIFLISITT